MKPARRRRPLPLVFRPRSPRIDNGNHLLLSGNTDGDGSRPHRLARQGPGRVARFPFMDLATANAGPSRPAAAACRGGCWIAAAACRARSLADYLSLLRLRFGAADATVAETLGGTVLYDRLLAPLAIAALNPRPDQALSGLMWAVVAGSLLKAAARASRWCRVSACRRASSTPRSPGWRPVAGRLHVSRRIAGLACAANRVIGLRGPDGVIEVAPGEQVVLAVPAWVAADMAARLSRRGTRGDREHPLSGQRRSGGRPVSWAGVRHGGVDLRQAWHRLDHHQCGQPAAGDLSRRHGSHGLGGGAARAGLAGAMPPVRVVRERRATFAATAFNEAPPSGPRPAHVGCPENLAIAGDWTARGCPPRSKVPSGPAVSRPRALRHAQHQAAWSE